MAVFWVGRPPARLVGVLWGSVLHPISHDDVLVRGEVGVPRSWPLVGKGIGGFSAFRTRALWRALKTSLTRAAYAAPVSASGWMVYGTCLVASARIWSIAKTGHTIA